ncbi:MAG: FtsW/RodA/SpoVE family cell cycle protein, partial [Bacteroidales bacterium]|nr:FtsW/RodA/SpoVE family cell cycle protein [Bacteroidales bacterium]
MGKYFKGDSGIWTVMVLLSLVSMAAIYSATGLLAYRYHSGHVAYYVLRHGGLLLVSWVVMFCFHRIKYTRFARLSVLAYPIVIVLLVYALMLGEINGANRWVRILGFSFQPSEFAKVGLVAFLSRQLTIR